MRIGNDLLSHEQCQQFDTRPGEQQSHLNCSHQAVRIATLRVTITGFFPLSWHIDTSIARLCRAFLLTASSSDALCVRMPNFKVIDTPETSLAGRAATVEIELRLVKIRRILDMHFKSTLDHLVSLDIKAGHTMASPRCFVVAAHKKLRVVLVSMGKTSSTLTGKACIRAKKLLPIRHTLDYRGFVGLGFGMGRR